MRIVMRIMLDSTIGEGYLANMNFDAMSDRAAIKEMGRRLQIQRLNLNVTQAELAAKMGISRRSLQNLESGRSGALVVLIRALRAIGKLDSLDAFLPESGLSPLQLARLKGRERQRAGRPRRRTSPQTG